MLLRLILFIIAYFTHTFLSPQKIVSGFALSQTPLGELTTLPRPSSRHSRRSHPLDAPSTFRMDEPPQYFPQIGAYIPGTLTTIAAMLMIVTLRDIIVAVVVVT